LQAGAFIGFTNHLNRVLANNGLGNR